MIEYSNFRDQKFSKKCQIFSKKSFLAPGANYYMETIIDGYKFVIETNNANNIILEKVADGGNVISAIKQFIIFLHTRQIQYVTIYDCKKRDRYRNVLLHIYRNANNTEKWLYDMAGFIYDEDKIRCKVY